MFPKSISFSQSEPERVPRLKLPGFGSMRRNFGSFRAISSFLTLVAQDFHVSINRKMLG